MVMVLNLTAIDDLQTNSKLKNSVKLGVFMDQVVKLTVIPEKVFELTFL